MRGGGELERVQLESGNTNEPSNHAAVDLFTRTDETDENQKAPHFLGEASSDGDAHVKCRTRNTFGSCGYYYYLTVAHELATETKRKKVTRKEKNYQKLKHVCRQTSVPGVVGEVLLANRCRDGVVGNTGTPRCHTRRVFTDGCASSGC